MQFTGIMKAKRLIVTCDSWILGTASALITEYVQIRCKLSVLMPVRVRCTAGLVRFEQLHHLTATDREQRK